MSDSNQDHSQESASAGLVRTLIAVVILIAFFGTIGYSFWPQILLNIQGMFNRVQANQAEPVESKYFEVRNDSSASISQVRGVLKMMEIDFEAITKFLGKEDVPPVPLLIKDGSGQAMMDNNGLVLYYDQGIFDTSTIPFFLVFWLEGFSLSQGRLFYPGGFALYVTESVNPEGQFWGQSSHAWVKFFLEKQVLLAIEDAEHVGIPSNEESAVVFFQALLEGGSFMSWVAEEKGLEAARQVALNQSPVEALSEPLNHLQADWLEAISKKEIEVKPCRLAAGRSVLNLLCDYVDEKNP